jgi:hypothetical protein
LASWVDRCRPTLSKVQSLVGQVFDITGRAAWPRSVAIATKRASARRVSPEVSATMRKASPVFSNLGIAMSTFVVLHPHRAKLKNLPRWTGVWEDVATGYGTPSFNWSSGLVSHYGSTPSSSARPLDKIEIPLCYNQFCWMAYQLAISAPDDYRGF